MKCPKCGIDNNHVKDTRETNKGNQWRVRECRSCGHTFETLERFIENTDFDCGRNRDYHRGYYKNKKKTEL